jgi:hypothetical protein
MCNLKNIEIVRAILTIVFVFITLLSYCQTNDSTKIVRDTYRNYDELRDKQKEAEIETLTYLDSTFNFQVQIPNWLHLRETGIVSAWGGTLPAVEGIENAILIKSFDKNEFKTIVEFRKYIVEDLIFGQTPLWSNTHKFMGKKELGKYKNIGESYKVYLMQGKVMYHCEYILVETKTAYLWIDFTSTQETFDKNIDKFNEFMSGFKTTNF